MISEVYMSLIKQIEFSVMRFGVAIKSKEEINFIAYFNAKKDAESFKYYCTGEYPDLQFVLREFKC